AFTSTETSPWISLTGGNGTTPGTVTVNVDITGLAPDTYTDSIMVSADLLQSPKYVVVTLEVTPRPRNLVANPATINFSVVEGDPNPSVTTWITEEGGDNIPYSADVITASQWVELTNVSSTTPDSLYVLANLAGLSPGDYSATIQVSSGSADNSPIEIAVNLHIDPAPKYLAVSPPSLAFSAVLGAGNPPGQQLEVSETGGYGITFAASAQNGAWMTVVPQSTTTTALVDVTVDATGLGVGVYADTVVITSDDAENSPLTAQVTLEVLPAPEFVITLPQGLDSMHFSGVEDEPDPPSQTFGVALSDGGAVTFGASTLASWITLTDETGTTPSEVTVDVQMAGLEVGTHHDSILVGEIFTLDGGSVYSESAEDVWVQVYLVIDPAPRYLVVDPDSADFVINEGVTSTTPASFIVTEAGGDTVGISFGTPPSWVQLHIADTSYSTPDTITYDIDVSGLAPGHYFDSIAISSPSPLVVNDPIYHLITLQVTPCPELVIDPATEGPHVFSVFEGATVFLEAPVGLLSTGPGELDWYADLAQSSSYFSVDISQGTTPSEVGMTYNRTFEVAGHYYDSLLFRSDPVEGSTCSSMALMLVDVTVRRPPSDDTVVVGTPAVRPGESIPVPIDFANSCDLFGASGSASWGSEYLYLDSISYEQSALSDFVHTVYINNDENYCTFSSAIGGCCPVPPKEDGAPLHNWLNLHFSVHCDAPDGFYPLTVPMTDSAIVFQIDCGQGIEEEIPEVDTGYVAVEYGENDFCAWVFDLADSSAIGGATVEMWTPFPVIGPGATATTNGHGSFAMTVVPGSFDLWIYADGYYPLEVENPVRGQKMYLTRLPEFTFTPSSQYVFYYCGTNTLFDEPMPVGSVVEVKVGDLLVGRQDSVTTPGVYQFLPVYRASSQFSDDGANYQDILTFYVNGQQAVATGDVEFPAEDFLEIEVCLTAGAVDEEECFLSYGWNLVSWDIDTDNDIVELFSDYWQDIDAIVGFEKGGLAYDPDLPQFSTLWEVDHLSGYWINVNNVDGITLYFSGLAVP
ncbi:MAG: hypothetical protein JSU65_03275, partial [Candidatus Zixiibacteriota bacterium]